MKKILLLFLLSIFVKTEFIDGSNPTMSRVRGNQFTQGVVDSQANAQIGTLDAIFGSNGSLNINSVLSGGQAVRIETLLNGDFLVVVAKTGQDSKVAMYNAEGILQTSYGINGIVDLGSGSVDPQTTMLDAQGRLLVAGGNFLMGSAGRIIRISADGMSMTEFETDSHWRFIGGIAQQSTGAIIAGGLDGTHARIGRYNLDGSLDTSFGTDGFVILNGANGLPTSDHGLHNVIVDANNNMYFLILNGTSNPTAHLIQINANGSFTNGHSYAVTYLNDGTDLEFKIAMNQDGNLILAAAVSNVIKVTAMTTSGGSVDGFTNFASTIINSNHFVLNDLIIATDDTIFLIGSDTTIAKMAVIRLVGSSGVLDTAFNGTGYNLFFISGAMRTISNLEAAAIAPDGQLYVSGYQINSGTTVPYVSRLNNTQYVSEVPQFPNAQEQGILDLTFGDASRQTNAGVTALFNGLTGPSLLQQAESMMEIISTSGLSGDPVIGDILVAMNGLTDNNGAISMMFAWLTAAGDVDGSVGNSGYLTLNNETDDGYEFVSNVIQGPSGVVFIAGTADSEGPVGAILRGYTHSSTSGWTTGSAAFNVWEYNEGWNGIAVGYQASTGYNFLFVDEGEAYLDQTPETGHISCYNGPSLVTGFGDEGVIYSNTFEYLNLGPCYGGLVDANSNLIVAYKDIIDGTVKVAMIQADGDGLVQEFGDSSTPGVTLGLFDTGNGAPDNIAYNNISICYNQDYNIVVTAIDATTGAALFFTLLDNETGQILTETFGTDNTGVLIVPVQGAENLGIYSAVGVSDGTTVVNFDGMVEETGDYCMYLMRITYSGALDISFNSQGAQPGILPVQIGNKVPDYYNRTATAALIQSTAETGNQGNILMTGYEQVTSGDSTSMVVRAYGDPGTVQIPDYSIIDNTVPGTFDYAADLVNELGNAQANVVFVYPSRNLYQGYMLIGYDNGTTSCISRLNVSDLSLDTTFATEGIYTIPGDLDGISCISIDAQNNILVGGATDDGNDVWAQQIDPNGMSVGISFEFPILIEDQFIGVSKILQQTSGRYIVACQIENGFFSLVAFQDKLTGENTTLQIDPTFNPLGDDDYYGQPGLYGIYNSYNGYNIAINNDDTIVACYPNDSFVMTIVDIAADGSGFVPGFNNGQVVVTDINPDNSLVCDIALDGVGNIIVAASTGEGSNVKIARYSSDGAFDPSWNGGNVTTVSNLGSAGITLSDLMETTADQTIFLGYNTAGGNGLLFACRLNSSGTLDSTWNPNATGSDTPGVLTFNAINREEQDLDVVALGTSALMTLSGKIVTVGRQENGTAGDPIIMFIYGDNYVDGVAQAPLESPAGILDYTLPSNVSGSWDMTSGIEFPGIAQQIFIFENSSNGAMWIGSSDGENSYISLLNADLSLAADPIEFTDQLYLANMHVIPAETDEVMTPVYVTGNNAEGGMWAAQYTVNMESETVINYVDNSVSQMQAGNVIRQTTNSRILVAGTDVHGNAAIGAFQAVAGAPFPIDTSFGNADDLSPNYGGGVYSTGVEGAIYAMAVDSLDRIYIAYQNSSSIIVVRLLANGTEVDDTFNALFTNATYGYSEVEICIALDETNSQVIVAAQDGQSNNNIIQLCRFDFEGNSQGALSTISLSNQVLNVSNLFLDVEQNIYVVGDTNSSNLVVARVASVDDTTIILDPTYAVASSVPGIAYSAAGYMIAVNAGAYNPDRRTYLVGTDDEGGSYMARFYGDIYTQEVAEPTIDAQVGAIDITLQPNNTGAIDLSDQSGWFGLEGFIVSAIATNPNNDGSAYIALCNGSYLVVGQVDADMNPVLTFGVNGLTSSIIPCDFISSMTIDAFGNIIVAGGGNEGAVGVIFNGVGDFLAYFDTDFPGYPTTIVQQRSGRYIVGAYIEGSGYIVAYQNPTAIEDGILSFDFTFGPADEPCIYEVDGSSSVDDLCIDDNDNIYFVYRNRSNTVCLGKLAPNGSGLSSSLNSPNDPEFNNGQVVTTSLSSVSSLHQAHVAINNDGNILVGVTLNNGNIQAQFFDGLTGVGSSVFSVSSSSSAVLSRLIGSNYNPNEGYTTFYGVFYDTVSNNITAFSLLGLSISGSSSLQFDPHFGTTDSVGSGYTTVSPSDLGLQDNTPIEIAWLAVQYDGKLIAVGADQPEQNDPLLVRFYGYPYVQEYAQAPDQAPAGILDSTLWSFTDSNTSPAYPLDNTINEEFNSFIENYAVRRVFESSAVDEALMTFVADSGTNTVIFQLLKDLTLNVDFNDGGWRSLEGSFGGTTGLFMNADNNIYITGNFDGGSWAYGIDEDGRNLFPSFSADSSMYVSNAISQQSNSRVIMAGQETSGGNATLYGFNIFGHLDDSFGNHGIVYYNQNVPFTDITIDDFDNIIGVVNNSGDVYRVRISASGLTVNQLSCGTNISGAIGNPKVVLDANGYVVVAAATATGYAINSYHNNAMGTNIGSVTFTAGITPVLSNIYATSDGKITLIGYDSATTGETPGYAIVARLVSSSGSLVLDETFNTSAGYLVASYGEMNQIFDGIIHADDRIMIVGSNSSSAQPLMGRVFGDYYVDYVSQAPVPGIAGTLNTSFGNTNPSQGYYNYGSGVLAQAQGQAILPIFDGGYYLAFNDANSGANSILVKTLANGVLDTFYNSTGIATSYAPLGVNSILLDGSDNMLLVGSFDGTGWIQRYTSAGVTDTTFGSSGIVNLPTGAQATIAIEQTLARLVVAGINADGYGALFAYQSLSPNGQPGAVDTTFNAGTGGTPGTFATTVLNVIPTLIADEYDRLIFGILTGSVVNLYRLTPTGEYDITFGSSGIVTALLNAADASSVRVALDVAGNIIVAATSSTANTFSVVAFDNGTSQTAGENGGLIYEQLNISLLTGPTVTNLVTAADGYTFVLGDQSGSNPAWIARITSDGHLDVNAFNPNGIGGVAGIFQYAGIGTIHNYNGLAVNADGTLGMFGYEVVSSIDTPILVSVYNDPYTFQESQSPDAQPVGTVDLTLGVSPTAVTDKGIVFYGSTGTDESYNQSAAAIGLYDDNNIVVAINGANASSNGLTDIFMNMFDNDGISNPNFGDDETPGSAVVLDIYDNQFATDMVTFTTANGVVKAILAGYVYNSILNTNDSLIIQYILTPGIQQLDPNFGGFDSNPLGIAFGDGNELYCVGRQTNGRIVASGVSQDGYGLLLGYTSEGKLDASFGNSGYQSSNTGTEGIYAQAIDTENRILIGYRDDDNEVVQVARFLADGSALDSTWTLSSNLLDNSSFKIAVDSSNNVYSIVGNGNSILVQSYDQANGSIIHTATYDATSIGGQSDTSSYNIGRVIIDAAGNVVIAAYDGALQQILVMRLTNNLALDTSFNDLGYVLYAVVPEYTSSQVVTDAMIHPDGRILVVGSEKQDEC